MSDKVEVTNLHKRYRVDERFAEKLISAILKLIKKEGRADFECVFVDDASIKMFNQRYKSENRPTDVLSFRIDRQDAGQKKFLGEIIISLDTALDNSKVFGTAFADEIVLYMVHGILHLFGFDDTGALKRRRMFAKQDMLMERLRKCEDLSKVLMPR